MDETRFLNKASAIFERYRIATELLDPDFADYYTIRQDNVYDVINEFLELARNEYPQWNFPKFPA